MTAYCIWDVREIHDQAAMDDYVAGVTESVTAYGGRYLVVGGPWQIVEGGWRPAYPVVIEFPSLERAHEWYSSESYAPLRELRHRASTCDAVFVDGAVPADDPLCRAADAPLADVGFDLYRDVHKGIRHGLFTVTEGCGHVDPFDESAVRETNARVEELLHLLDVHSRHEDEFLGPIIGTHLPTLAAQLHREHTELEALTTEIRRQLATTAQAVGVERRLAQHRLYLTLSEFTGVYLRHQTTEEVEVLPALNRAAGPGELEDSEQRARRGDHTRGHGRLHAADRAGRQPGRSGRAVRRNPRGRPARGVHRSARRGP